MAKEVSQRDEAAQELPAYSGPLLETLRKNLAELVTGGLVPDNVAEKGGDLLKLKIVTSRLRLSEEADEDEGEGEDERDKACLEALTEVLRDAVKEGRVFFKKHRRLLRIVLPLHADLVGKPIEMRRTEAGKKMINGKEIKPGTIRTYHEPRALDELARVLLEMEAEHRGESPTDSSP
jgi:hypothetical protein